MKQKLINASPIIIVLIIFFLLTDGFSFSSPTAVAQQEVVQAAVVQPTPRPTQMIVMNSATATAIAPTPRPTMIPEPSPTLIPKSFAPGGEKEATADIWFKRILIILAFLFVFWLAFIFREIKLYEAEAAHEEKLAEISALEKLKINPRPIVQSKRNGELIELANGTSITKTIVAEFINLVMSGTDELGLAISKWKKLDGWEQADIENIIDQLAEAGMVTKRENGRASSWLVDPSKRSLSRVFRLSPFEL